MSGDKKLAVLGIVAACAIGFINHIQYRSLANRMEDMKVTVEMELFPIHTFIKGMQQRLHAAFAQRSRDLQYFDHFTPGSGCSAVR